MAHRKHYIKKIKSFFTLLLVSLCLIVVSCKNSGDGNWMEGYWVDDESSSYLYVNGGKIYMAPPTSKRKTILDYNHVKALFDKRNFEPYEIIEIGNAIGVGDEGIYYRDIIGVKDINKIKTVGEYITESEWRVMTRELSEPPKESPSHDYYYLGSVQCGVSESILFSEAKEKKIVYIEYDLDYGDASNPKRYSKIEPTGKEKELSPEDFAEESWGELFDERGIVVFDTGLTSNDYDNSIYHYYLFFRGYSHSNMTEGTVSMCDYHIINKSMVGMNQLMRFNYVFKNGRVYLTTGEWQTSSGKWNNLGIHEMSFEYNSDDSQLNGTFWFREDKSYNIYAKPIDFDYVRWLSYNMF